MDLGLLNKRVLVLAASKGLGLSVAKSVLCEGARVAILGRDKDQLPILANSLSMQYNSDVVPIVADLAMDNCEEIIAEEIDKHFGQIDILVNNTGGPPFVDIHQIELNQWQDYFKLMVTRLISITELFLPSMLNQQWGRILNVASTGIIKPIAGLALSNSLRSALVMWGQTLAQEVASKGVTVNTLLPSKIHTDRVDDLNKAKAKEEGISQKEMMQKSIMDIPMKRYGKLEEFGDVAAFLVSERASYITGSCIRVDGGLLSLL